MKGNGRSALAVSVFAAALLSAAIQTPAFAAAPHSPIPHPWSQEGGPVPVDPSGEIGDTPTDPTIKNSKPHPNDVVKNGLLSGSSGPHYIQTTNPDMGDHTPARHAISNAQMCFNSQNNDQSYGYRLYLNRPGQYAWASSVYYGPKSGTCSPWKNFNDNFAGLLQQFSSPRLVWSDVWLYWN